MTKEGDIGGATKYFFAMCFVSIPAIIYLTMVPMWSRAQRFASAYAFLAVDALYTILWFAAFISVAVWNANGIREGAAKAKIPDDDKNCTTFLYGDEAKCAVSKAAVGVGVMVFIFFAITTGVSGYYLHKYLREGKMPYQSSSKNPFYETGDSSYNPAGGATDLNAKDTTWSTEIETAHGRDSSDTLSDDRRTEHGGNQHEDEYALLHSTDTDEGRHPGRPLSWGEERNASVYGAGSVGARSVPPYADYSVERRGSIAAGVDALSPGGYDEFRRDAAGGIDRAASHSGSGYSFSGGPGR
ncbi:MARVEL domain containing protein [Pyrenophora tritici-repentis]|uniref:MARVEL domain containing protein n=1 Tax=Pyrenophora tritici-repentis TaxID=45151 RepID=A0A922NRU1_9PLEO|nr:MARVEL domain containing protein [Pyrenophora tritici-repentis]KAI1674606.1 MARVEL domain containing protein [Pyrenophora tritici-repentis]